MGDKTEQPGPEQNKAKVIEPIEGEDVEGHRKLAKETDDEPGSTEGRGKKFADSDEDDVEGHKLFAM